MTTPTAPAAAPEDAGARNLTLLRQIQKYLLVTLLVIEILVFTLLSPQFLTTQNWVNIALNSADLALVAAGLTLIVIMAGIDVATKAEIHRDIHGLVAQGMAVLLISSEMSELLELADVVHTLHEGHMTSTLTGAEITEAAVLRGATGVLADATAGGSTEEAR